MAEEFEIERIVESDDDTSSPSSPEQEEPSSSTSSGGASQRKPERREGRSGRPPTRLRGVGRGAGSRAEPVAGPSTSGLRQGRGRRSGVRGRTSGGRGRTSRGRGRRSGGRGREFRLTEEQEERIRDLREARHKELESMCDGVDKEVLKGIVVKVCDRNPALALDIKKILQENLPGGSDPEPLPPQPDSPDWCMCGACVEMPTEAERLCCQKPPAECKSRDPVMELNVTDEFHLGIMRVARGDILGFQNEDRQPGEEDNAAMRHNAYRSFIMWQYNRLTPGDRRVIPSCCVWFIRNKFPSPTGQYRGFDPGRIV
ncbi:uncharacterized protein LOC106154127 isoform X1 [Lingula anatina]|uniref:Uncharacterized protein LOC106154127 isoform X1 n=1 Tax=Lingula anatina TaxID=7574 RepID=A0A1S3HCQ8_LINAN|nr:uncharacterized protein LOC106154127 isoform X1 [Lingula anatina]|eukprot:XP_013383832.1 uncharacterized protein LOC106154127 isoform X1 [Lingula anatina]